MNEKTNITFLLTYIWRCCREKSGLLS